ncbi:hypothetical protein [Flavobacterium sp. WC2509]|uniref:hypothetical protein n=1 Tax=Flavobacterium sp. WC2509 TaxID=3461406 RepID=UPI004044CE41
MKKIKIIIISLAVVIFLYLIHFDLFRWIELHNCIIWNENSKTTFNDFEAKPDNTSEMNLVFYHGFYLYSSPFNKPKVIAIFDRDQSWVKDTTKFNFRELLKLQQIAFNLTEVYARKCNAEIKKKGYDKNGNQKSFDYLTKLKDSVKAEYYSVKNQMLNEDNKSANELINHWKPKVDNMLKAQKNSR